MITNQRRQSLLARLRKQPGLRVTELATALDVSEGTVRNDLNALEEQGLLTRVHGGAVLYPADQFLDIAFARRCQQNAAAKRAIAREAAALVNDGDSIMLDASSTACYLAKFLSERQRLRVLTNGFEVARDLAQNSTNTVILIGGLVNSEASSVTGLFSKHIIENLHIQKAFLSCSGFSLELGMMELLPAEGQLKEKLIGISDQLIALVDSSKFGKEELISFAHPDRINRLFTDHYLCSVWRECLSQAEIEFTICEEELSPVR